LGVVLALAAGLGSVAAGAGRQPGSAKGTLAFGTNRIALSHALAASIKDASGAVTYVVLVTNKPVPGADPLAAVPVALLMAEHEIHGIEVVVGTDKRVARTNVYGPPAGMGARLFESPRFEPATFDGKTIAGRLAIDEPIDDTRLGTTIHFDVTFTAPVRPEAR
jgi:hypothetical protein